MMLFSILFICLSVSLCMQWYMCLLGGGVEVQRKPLGMILIFQTDYITGLQVQKLWSVLYWVAIKNPLSSVYQCWGLWIHTTTISLFLKVDPGAWAQIWVPMFEGKHLLIKLSPSLIFLTLTYINSFLWILKLEDFEETYWRKQVLLR